MSGLADAESYADSSWQRFSKRMGFSEPRQIVAYSGYSNGERDTHAEKATGASWSPHGGEVHWFFAGGKARVRIASFVTIARTTSAVRVNTNPTGISRPSRTARASPEATLAVVGTELAMRANSSGGTPGLIHRPALRAAFSCRITFGG